ncbi:pentapeptide repeat-containing protein [bacterium]|nr:pentapeptide repeat-containing protein [bacterium]
MRRLAPLGAALLCVSLGAAALSQAQDEPEKPRKKKPKPDGPKEPEISKDEEANLAPEARLCVKIARGDVIRGLAVEPYIDLLSDGNVPDWNGRRKQDGGKLLDLAGRTWDPKGRDDLELKLEGLDLQGADLSNVLFAPKTSFRFSDLTGASFRGSCLEGVEFASVWAFANGARSAKTVKSTSVADADFRDCVWFWCTALDRTVQRTFEEARSDDPQAKARRLAERQRQLMALQRLVNGWGGEPPVFAFVDLDGVKKDKENSLGPLDPVDEQQVPPQMRSSRTLEKLIKAARAGTIERAINKLADHRHIARQRECTNPLRFEPALAEAIAACDSRLARVATWKAVKLSDMAGRDPNEEAIVVGGPDIVFVVDDEPRRARARRAFHGHLPLRGRRRRDGSREPLGGGLREARAPRREAQGLRAVAGRRHAVPARLRPREGLRREGPGEGAAGGHPRRDPQAGRQGRLRRHEVLQARGPEVRAERVLPRALERPEGDPRRGVVVRLARLDLLGGADRLPGQEPEGRPSRLGGCLFSALDRSLDYLP